MGKVKSYFYDHSLDTIDPDESDLPGPAHGTYGYNDEDRFDVDVDENGPFITRADDAPSTVMVELESVGCMFDTSTGDVSPMMEDGFTWDKDNAVNILTHDQEWFEKLSIRDFEVVEGWFNDEDLDVRAMLEDDWMEQYCEKHPDFNDAMNGMVWEPEHLGDR